MARNVVHNDGFYEWLGQQPGVDKITREGAEVTLAEAKAGAPVRDGDYLDSLHIEKSTRPGRVTYLVVADAPHSLIVEARNGTLARAVKRAGLA